MATIRPYINHLLQNTGITPACSEEERTAADDLARIFKRHGFEPEVQEFSASGSKKIVSAVLGIAAFLGALLMGIGGVVGFVGILLTLAAAVIYTMERMGRPVLSGIGSGGLSQNVIAYHKASGPLASPRNRPVVVVAHYDSPRVDVLSQMPYAAYRPLMAKLLPAAMLAPAIIAIVRLLPFPDAAKTVFWLLAVVAALVPLANAVAIILNRFVLPYTTGSVCNKSSVAALLGVMNAVAPYRGENEFPGDIPFDEYFAEQRRVADELAAAALEAEGDLDEILTDEDAVEEEGVAEDGAAIVESEDASDVAVDVAPADVSEPVDLGETQAMNMSDLMGQTATVSVTEGEKTGVVAAPEATVEDEQQTTIADEGAADAADDGAAIAEEPESAAPAQPSIINAAGNYRYGIEALRALGMVSESCVIEYDMPEPEPAAPAASEPARAVDAAAGRTVASVATAEPVLESATDPSVAAPLNEMAPERDPFAYHEDEDAFADDDRFDAAGEDAADDSFEGDFAYGEAYEDEGLEISRRGAPRIEMATQNSLATALSAFGESASRFFSKALEHGKSALGEIENVARTAMEKRAAHDEADVLPADDEEILSEDIKDTVDSPDADTVDAASGDEVDATISAAPLSEDTADDAAADASADEDPFDPAALDSTRAFHADEVAESDETVERTAVAPAAPLPGETVAVPAQSVKQAALQESAAASKRPMDTVDALMAQITGSVSAQASAQRQQQQPRRAPLVVPDPAQPSLNTPSVSNRASLFDLPDPAAADDPFAPASPAPAASPTTAAVASAQSAPAVRRSLAAIPSVDAAPSGSASSAATAGFSVVPDPAPKQASEEPFGTISAAAPVASGYRREEKRSRGLFRRKNRDEPSMSEYLGVDSDFDAKNSGRSIGSWDNFDEYDDDWKGGATGSADVTVDELRDAITSMDDDELLGHDIWFVATGASEYEHAGMQAFLNTHRDKLRGVFLINLECIGAGQIAMLSSEGEHRVLKGDKRIMNLVRRVSGAFHHEFGAIDMPYLSTDSYAAMSMSLRSLTIAGIDGPRLACARTEEDQAYNVDVENINMVADVVTEVIRRS